MRITLFFSFRSMEPLALIRIHPVCRHSGERRNPGGRVKRDMIKVPLLWRGGSPEGRDGVVARRFGFYFDDASHRFFSAYWIPTFVGMTAFFFVS
jgi:hypothetical protein